MVGAGGYRVGVVGGGRGGGCGGDGLVGVLE